MYESTNSVVQTLWIGPLSPLEQTCLTSFVQQGHTVHLYVYDRPTGVPDGVTVCDAEEILPKATIVANQLGRGRGSYAGFADLFRYTLLWKRGGWWVDADIFCLRPFDFPAPYVFAAEDKPVANGVIKAPAGCPLMERCTTQAASVNLREIIWNELGDIFAANVFALNLSEFILPAQTFSPVPFDRIVDAVRGRCSVPIPAASHAVHLYNEMWRRKGLSKFRAYPEGSLFEQLRRRAGLAAPETRSARVRRLLGWRTKVALPG